MPISNLVDNEGSEEAPKEQPSSVASDDSEPSTVVSHSPAQTVPLQDANKTTPATSTTDTPTGTTEGSPAVSVVNEKSQYDKITDALLSRMGSVGSKSSMKMCIYGPPGGTKSGFLSQIEGLLAYDLEDGNISMATQEAFTSKPRARGQRIMPFSSFREADLLVERLSDNAAGFEEFKCFGIDTFSDFYKRALEDEVQRRWSRLPESMRQVTSQFGADKEDYQPVNGLMLNFIRRLRNMDRDLVILAHHRTVEPKGQMAKTFPDFSESLANKIEGMMDVVAYMEMMQLDDGTEAPVMRTKSDGKIHAKSRVPLPTLIINPDYNDIKAIWMEWKEKAEAES